MGDGEEDLISALHDDLLGKIISRLLVKDAARTAVLASRWRHVWRSTPLVLYDGDLPEPTRAATVTRVLADHPGPFRVVLIQNCRLASHSPELAEWPRLLAAKDVETLLFAYQKPAGKAQGLPRIPADIFRCASLKQLFLNCWTWTIPPDHLSRSRSLVVFPQLLLLTLTNIAISDQDLDHLLAASPVLENIILACPLKRLHVRSQSLRSVLVSLLDEFAVVEAPLLDRLFFARPPAYIIGAADPVRLRIASTSNLRVLGYINPMVHKLHINGNIIKPDTMASPSTVVPGIQILALNVNFCDLEEVKMAASLLRCFPNTCTLHIQVFIYLLSNLAILPSVY
uniref:Uncharacterized protein n=1 Tax=Avena sativa TaxID=4498 RepID=A0ACD5T6J1_AVESA